MSRHLTVLLSVVVLALAANAPAVYAADQPELTKKQTKRLIRKIIKKKINAILPIETPNLATEAVTTPKIESGAVTTSEIADGAVTAAKLSPSAVAPATLPISLVTENAVVGPVALPGFGELSMGCSGPEAQMSWKNTTGESQTVGGPENYRPLQTVAAGATANLPELDFDGAGGFEHDQGIMVISIRRASGPTATIVGWADQPSGVCTVQAQAFLG